METRSGRFSLHQPRNVLILPMRNGNSLRLFTFLLVSLFLSYLWGMETCYGSGIYSSKKRRVLILPMRNGNVVNRLYVPSTDLSSYPTYEEWKRVSRKHSWFYTPFLSYLWGMETKSILKKCYLNFYCSYPTYEEWKLCTSSFYHFLWDSSYPTYEEWKQFI